VTNNTNTNQLWPADLIEKAIGIIMNRFDLDAAQALKVLRRMSRAARTQMCVVAERIINHNDPVEALRRLDEDALDLGGPQRRKR
jgi:AmiR/NasT family two-component response regulator